MASAARGDDPPRCGPQMPPPSVSRRGRRWGGGGPASPGSSAAEIGESPEEGGEGARPSCGRKTSFPSLPPSRGRPGLSRPQQPGSELPRPADRLLQRSWDSGAGYGEDTDSWGARKTARFGQRGRGPGPRAPAGHGLGPGPLPGKMCDRVERKEPGPAARTSGAQAGAPQRRLSCSPSPTGSSISPPFSSVSDPPDLPPRFLVLARTRG